MKKITLKEVKEIYDRAGTWETTSRRTIRIANAVSYYYYDLSDRNNTPAENRRTIVRAAWETLNTDDERFSLTEQQEMQLAHGGVIL